MPENAPPQKKNIGGKITDMLEAHPILIAGVIAGAVLGITLLFRGKSGGGNLAGTATTSTGLPVYTDGSGNPVDPYTGQPLAGAQVSPGISAQDFSTMLSNFGQQLQNAITQIRSGNPPSTNPPPVNNPPSTNPPPTNNPPPVTNPPHVTPPPVINPIGRLPQYVTVTPWPNTPYDSLWNIWSSKSSGLSWNQWESRVLALNPQIHNPNLIYPGEKILLP